MKTPAANPAAGSSPAARLWLYRVPAGLATVLLWTVPNIVAVLRGGLKAPPGMNDFSLHSTVFLVVGFLWYRAMVVSPATWLARWAAAVSFSIALAVGAIDEAIQALPFLPRNTSWEDFLADAVGCTLAAVIAFEASRIAARRRRQLP